LHVRVACTTKLKWPYSRAAALLKSRQRQEFSADANTWLPARCLAQRSPKLPAHQSAILARERRCVLPCRALLFGPRLAGRLGLNASSERCLPAPRDVGSRSKTSAHTIERIPKQKRRKQSGKKREKVSAVAKSQQHPTHVTDSNCQLPVVSRWLNSPVGSLLISLCASGERNRSRTLRSLLTQFCQVIGPLRFVIAEKVATFRCPRP
jgi:hypothetical protein